MVASIGTEGSAIVSTRKDKCHHQLDPCMDVCSSGTPWQPHVSPNPSNDNRVSQCSYCIGVFICSYISNLAKQRPERSGRSRARPFHNRFFFLFVFAFALPSLTFCPLGFAAFTSGQDQRMTGRLVRSSTFVPVTILPQLLFASVPLSTSSAFATQSISLQTMLDGLRCDLDLPRLEQQFFSTASASATAPTAARLKPLIPQTIARRLLGVQVSLSMRIVDSTVIVLATESLVTAVESTSVDLDLGFPTNTSADVHATFCVQLNNLFVNAVDHAISYDR